MSSSVMSVEKCFEEAEDSGVLQINHKGLKVFPVCVDDYDLVDVLTVDISRNRFSELPQEIVSFVMMERINCKNNFLKTLPDLSHLNALTYIDISQNMLQSLPIHMCSLPLKILSASHNKISILPSEIGLLSKLQSLDLSNNELTNLPSTLGDLTSLRRLNIRRNNIVTLPDELSKLKNLCKLDFSCNKISTIPPAFRLISSLIELDLTNNPLSSPPAQICLRGRLHIVKYLSLAAQQQEKRWTMPKENNTNTDSSPTPITNNNSTPELFIPVEQQQAYIEVNDNQQNINKTTTELTRHNTLTNDVSSSTIYCDGPQEKGTFKDVDVKFQEEEELGRETVDYAGQKNDEEKSNTLTRLSQQQQEGENVPLETPTKEKPKVASKPNSFSVSTREKQEKLKTLQEKGKLTPQPYQPRLGTPTDTPSRRFSDNSSTESRTTTSSLDRASLRSVGNHMKSNDIESADQKTEEERRGNIAARKEQLLKNKEEILKSKHRLELIKSKSASRTEQAPMDKPEVISPKSISSQASDDSNQSRDSVFDGISKRNALKPKSNSKKLRDGASNYTMRRFYDTAKEEFEELEKLREAIETRLRIKLPDDLPASLSDGIVLCHLVNHLHKGTISIIHVPSSGVPKLTMPKCQMNVDAFLDAARRLGVGKVDMCTPPDILEEKSPAKLCRCVQALLLALGAAPPQIVMANAHTPR